MMLRRSLLVSLAAMLVCSSIIGNPVTFASAAEEDDVDYVSITSPVLKDTNGKIVNIINPGQQSLISITLINNDDSSSQPFTALIELRDSQGMTWDLRWHTGTLAPNGMQEIEIPWIAEFSESKEISARAFAISSLENPIILSSIKSTSFSVLGHSGTGGSADNDLPPPDNEEAEGEGEEGGNGKIVYDLASDYTVLVYMVGSDLESQGYSATTDVYEMLAVGSTENISVVIETGGADASPDDYRFLDFREVQRIQILKGEYLPMQNLGERNMGDPETLSEFIEWGVLQFPAEKYAIILWDHGNGINGFGVDELYGDYLTLDELETAFDDARDSTGVNFELIGFDACLMATIEVASRLGPYGDYLVASQEIEPGWGWDYTAILSSLVEEPEQDGYALGRNIADSYMAHIQYNADLSQDYGSQKSITLSVIDLGQISAVHKAITTLAQSLDGQIVNLDSSYLLARAVDSTERYGVGARISSGHADLYHLASNIESEFSGYQSLVREVQDSIDDAVVYKVNGEAKPNANGISIYIPMDAEQFNDDYILYTLSGWGNLLETQQSLLESDTVAPEVNLQFNGETVSGYVEGDDVATVMMFISSELYDNTRSEVLSYLELDPSWIINPDGSMEFVWSQQIISLCNEEFCAPTLMDLEVTEDTMFALFPVRLEAEGVDESVTLIYEVYEDAEDGASAFEFLGAWPEIDDEGTVSRELWPLYIGDKIYTYTYEYDIADEEYIQYLEYEPIEVTENFQPEYFTYTGTYYLSFGVCDYSDNCSYSQEFSFVIEQEEEGDDDGSGSGTIYEENLDVLLWFEDPIVRGNEQTITVQVFDENTEYVIEDAYVAVTVNYASGQTTKEFFDYADGDGYVEFTWRIGGNSNPGMFDILIDVSADGYEPESYVSSFEVIPAS